MQQLQAAEKQSQANVALASGTAVTAGHGRAGPTCSGMGRGNEWDSAKRLMDYDLQKGCMLVCLHCDCLAVMFVVDVGGSRIASGAERRLRRHQRNHVGSVDEAQADAIDW